MYIFEEHGPFISSDEHPTDGLSFSLNLCNLKGGFLPFSMGLWSMQKSITQNEVANKYSKR